MIDLLEREELGEKQDMDFKRVCNLLYAIGVETDNTFTIRNSSDYWYVVGILNDFMLGHDERFSWMDGVPYPNL